MATFVFANFLKTTLSSGISSTATTLTVSSTANLPVLQVGQVLPVVLNDAATQSIYEICYATAISSNTLTVLRGQEGTTANTWNTGDYVYTAVTAGSFASLPQLGASNLWTANNNFATLNFVQDTGTQNNIVVNPANPVTLQTGTEINVKVAYSNDSATTLNYANTGALRVIGAGGPLQGENLVAGYIYKFVYLSGSTNYWYLIASSQGAISVGAATQSEHAIQLGQFTSNLSASGYQKLPNGLTFQWGNTPVIAADTGFTEDFNFTFPTACVYVNYIALTANTGQPDANPSVTYTTSSFSGFNQQTNATAFNWFAIGY